MEEVLDVYQRPYDPRFPQLCMDEGSKQVLAERREPLPTEPGKLKREDNEYEHKGTCKIFAACEPLTGKSFFSITDRRTKEDWAYFMRDLLDVQYKDAEKIILVMDNLNTHALSSFYKAFEAPEARRLLKKVEIHYTPKHGSWLNIAEIILSTLARQCLRERVTSIQEVQERVLIWQEERNTTQKAINWRFTTEDARIKLKRLYPVFNQ